MTPFEWSTHKVVAMTRHRVQHLAQPQERIRLYSQSCNPTFSLLRRDQQTSGGVCEALCCFWSQAAKRNEDFWAGLLRADGSVSMLRFAPVAALQAEGRMSADHRNLTEVWMAGHGMSIRPALQEDSQHVTAADLADSIVASPNAGAPLRLIYIAGVSAHRMAAQVEGGTVRFFDPNYGDFLFGSIDRFREWFLRYWQRSFYYVGLSDSYRVDFFEK